MRVYRFRHSRREPESKIHGPTAHPRRRRAPRTPANPFAILAADAPPSSRGLGHRPLTAETGVRIPVAVLHESPANAGLSSFSGWCDSLGVASPCTERVHESGADPLTASSAWRATDMPMPTPATADAHWLPLPSSAGLGASWIACISRRNCRSCQSARGECARIHVLAGVGTPGRRTRRNSFSQSSLMPERSYSSSWMPDQDHALILAFQVHALALRALMATSIEVESSFRSHVMRSAPGSGHSTNAPTVSTVCAGISSWRLRSSRRVRLSVARKASRSTRVVPGGIVTRGWSR